MYAWHGNLLDIINYIDQYIERDNIDRVYNGLKKCY